MVGLRTILHSCWYAAVLCAPVMVCHQPYPIYISCIYWTAAAKATAFSFHPLAECTCCPEPLFHSCQRCLLLLLYCFLSCPKSIYVSPTAAERKLCNCNYWKRSGLIELRPHSAMISCTQPLQEQVLSCRYLRQMWAQHGPPGAYCRIASSSVTRAYRLLLLCIPTAIAALVDLLIILHMLLPSIFPNLDSLTKANTSFSWKMQTLPSIHL